MPTRSADRRPESVSGRFYLAVAAWVIVASIAVANATPLRANGAVVAVAVAVVVVLYGVRSQRWGVAGSLTIVTLGCAVALVLDAPGIEIDYGDGPAASVGVRVIWVALAVVMAADILYAVWLSRAVADVPWDLEPELVQSLDHSRRELERQVSRLVARVDEIDSLLLPD